MLRVVVVFILSILLCSVLAAQGTNPNNNDSSAIKQTALDFMDGYYSGDPVRVERALHPDLTKAIPRDLPQTGHTVIAYSTYSGLIENARAGVGKLDDTLRNITVKIINIDGNIANVKMTSRNYNDYFLMIKIDGVWKIVNDLYAEGTGIPPRLKEFNQDSEKASIEKTVIEYFKGIFGGDAKRVEASVSPDFSKISLNNIAQTGKTSIRRQRYEAVLENAYAGLGKQDEVYRSFDATTLDVMSGIAIARGKSAGGYEYVQLFKTADGWKIHNSLATPIANVAVEEAFAVTVGDKMLDFTLPIYGGGEFTLSKYKGKNVLLMFPRGSLGTVWCPYCPYQYLELEQLESKSKIEEANNLKIAFVLPYSSDSVKDWMEKFPTAIQTVEAVKNPQPAPPAGSYQAGYAAWANKQFPKKFDVKADDPHKTIPVLVDDKRTLSRRLKISTNFWDGVAADMNIASIYIIDKNGILKFKYISQMTEDRPSVDFLLDIIKNLK
jgi:peroxiredoxin